MTHRIACALVLTAAASQAEEPVDPRITPETLAARVFELEKEAYPHVLRLFAARRVQMQGGRVRIAKAKRRGTTDSTDEHG